MDRVAEQFNDQGFAGPFRLASAAEMRFAALQIEPILNRPGPVADDPLVNRHIDSRVVAKLCTHPAIAEKATAILGPDVAVWNSVFFAKGPGAPEVHWHQDLHFARLDPPVTISAWIAIDPSHRSDSCLRLIPRSHGSLVPHVADADAQFGEKADPRAVPVGDAIDVEMDAGAFVLFDGRTLHGSAPGGGGRRLALSVRLTRATVTIDPSHLRPHGRVLAMPRPAGA